MSTHNLRKPDVEAIIADIVQGLDGRPDDDAEQVRIFHPKYIVIVGSHDESDGFCWCQPTETEVHIEGHYHEHPIHVDRVH